MTTIIRVKRHRGEDPVEALVLSCKKKKTEELPDGDSQSFQKILNFSGTVEEKDDNIAASTVQSYSKEKYPQLKTHTPDVRSKIRKDWKARTDDNRFTLLSCLRSMNEKSDDTEDTGKNVTIVDVSSESKEKSPEAENSGYVYDLYSTENCENDLDFNDLYMENLLSVQPLVFDLEYRNGEDCYEEVDPDEEDSNDENNWRNDYPDTDPDMDSNDDEEAVLRKQMKGFHLDGDDDGYELSNDSGEESYLNYEDKENYHYYEAQDLAGRRYARYKANALKHMMHDEDNKGESFESDDECTFYDSRDYEEISFD